MDGPDQTQARALLAAERARLQRLLQAATGEPQPADPGDEVDRADRCNAEQTGMAVDQLLRGHLFEVLADADITPEDEQASEENDDEPAPEPSLGTHIERDDRTWQPGPQRRWTVTGLVDDNQHRVSGRYGAGA